MKKHPPLIGLTLDFEEAGGWSDFPWYALRENYCAAITKAGGVPLCLPHEVELAEHYLALLSGLVVTGGAFDVDPALFGATEKHATVVTKERRTRFEWAMLQGALTRNMPILGICGGEQLINVVKGGTLVQHIPDEIAGAEEHEIKPKSKPAHTVEVEEKTLLHSIAGEWKFPVNTSHHQAVKEPGEGIVVNARAPDGVIEGIELTGHPFCLGVQWHPEFHLNKVDGKIFTAFIEAARSYGK